ncbi:unnamed protein product [Allacma fusca]|uniref:Uncharacterized protein n=1 Tax=Allacma fusca TaxID=39272 RepID=A0A8J2PQZ9_9HEXA|nr:unnamed protein product [Allacma fusca]
MIKVADKLFLLAIVLWVQTITGHVVQNRRNILNTGVRKVVRRNVIGQVVGKNATTGKMSKAVVNKVVVSKPVVSKPVNKVFVSKAIVSKPVNKVFVSKAIVSKPVNKVVVSKAVVSKPVNKVFVSKPVVSKPVNKVVVSKAIVSKPANKVFGSKAVVNQPVNKVVGSKTVISKTIVRKVPKKISAIQQPKSRYFSAPKSRAIQTILKLQQVQKNEKINLVRAINTSSGPGLNSSEIASSNLTEAESQSQEDVKHLWNPSFSIPTNGRFENGSLCLEEISECWGDSMCPWFEPKIPGLDWIQMNSVPIFCFCYL